MDIEILDPVHCKVDKKDIEFLRPCLSYEASYWRQGQWRREEKVYRKSLISKSGVFLTGFRQRIQEYCERNNIDVSWHGYEERLSPIKPNLPGITFREDQIKLIQQAVKVQRGVIKAPTGSGKTIIALGIMSCLPSCKILFLAHTVDLIDQTYDELKKFGFDDVGRLRGGKKELGRILVSTMQSFSKLDPWKSNNNSYDIVIVDECFPKNTRIKTTIGNKKIETIKIGDQVFTKSGINKVTNIFKNNTSLDNIIKLTLSDKRELICTKDHLLWADNKWLKAIDTKGKFLLDFPPNSFYKKLGIISNELGEEKNGRTKTTRDNMPYLQNSFQTKSFCSKILFKILCLQRSREKQELLNNNEENESKKERYHFNKNEKKQPHEHAGHHREDDEHKKDKWHIKHLVGRTWRKWKAYRTTNQAFSCLRMAYGMAYPLSSGQTDIKKKKLSGISRIPNLLQSRYWRPQTEDGNRNRRERSPSKISQSKGRKERTKTNRVRVEDIEIYKRGSNDKSFKSIVGNKERNQGFIEFYDLEVENDHSYFAEGVLVHNCHHISGFTNTYSKILGSLISPARFGLTATLPDREESRLALEGHIGPLIGELTIQEAASLNILAVPKIKLVKVPYNSSAKQQSRYPDVYQKGVVENKGRNRLILKTVRDLLAQGKTVLILVIKIQHGETLVNMAKEIFGFEIVFVQGATEADVRRETRHAMIGKEVNCVVSTAVWKEGINIPSLSSVVNAAGGKSEISTLQAIGRGLRKTDKKSEVLIVDFFDNSHHYLISHFGERLCLYMDQGWL